MRAYFRDSHRCFVVVSFLLVAFLPRKSKANKTEWASETNFSVSITSNIFGSTHHSKKKYFCPFYVILISLMQMKNCKKKLESFCFVAFSRDAQILLECGKMPFGKLARERCENIFAAFVNQTGNPFSKPAKCIPVFHMTFYRERREETRNINPNSQSAFILRLSRSHKAAK